MDVAIIEEEFIQNFNKIGENDSTSDVVESVSSYEGIDLEEYNQKLYDRISSLRKTILVLKKELKKEREIWRYEIENKKKYEYYSQISQYGANLFNMQGYQDTIMANYENRKEIEKQIEAANYKRKLLEVENMCQMELMKVKQSVQILQPLQVMMSEWKFENESGDSYRPSEVNIFKNDFNVKLEHSEVQMPLEETIRVNDVESKVCEVSSDITLEDPKLIIPIQAKQSKSQPDLKSANDV